MKSILYVCSDIFECRDTLSLLSKADNFSVGAVKTSDDTIEALKTRSIDLIVFDLRAPIDTLEETLKEIVKEFSDTPRFFIRDSNLSFSIRELLNYSNQSIKAPTNRLEYQRFLYLLRRTLIESISNSKPIKSRRVDFPLEVEKTLKQLKYAENEQDFVRYIDSNRYVREFIISHINSPIYSLNTRVKSVDRAVKLLGYSTILNILSTKVEAKSRVA